MASLSESELLLSLLAVALLLLAGRGIGEFTRRIGLPEVLGELFAGFLLGPSVFGALLPGVRHELFLNHTVGLVLSALSWLGAILLLFLAGLEVDLAILRQEARPGAFAAVAAIVPSLVAGSLFSIYVLNRQPPGAFFLGIVLSVTAVSVTSKILMERGVMRRTYAQIMLAAGVTSEVVVWLFVSVVASVHGASPLIAGVRSTLFALAFFAFMMTIGRRFTFFLMRRVRDVYLIHKGQLSLVIILALVAAGITLAMGLHPLLGAFVFGVVLARAPRTNESLMDTLEGMTTGIFAPIFFTLAGMRVDISQLRSLSTIGVMVLLFVVASVVKIGFSTLAARLAGQRFWEAALVGVGLNLKGGTDVIVAVIGTELGLLSIQGYTMYTIVAMMTVLLTPPVVSWLERHAPPGEEEQGRLESEEAERRSYVPTIERVMVPVEPHLLPTLAASVVERIAAAKHEQGQLFDITQLDIEPEREEAVAAQAKTKERLDEVGALGSVQVTQERVGTDEALEKILQASQDYDLIAIGAQPPHAGPALSLGQLQDELIDRAKADVLVAIDHRSRHFDCKNVGRILVPTNGLEYSMAAGDIAGSLAEACDAEMVILHVVDTDRASSAQERRQEEEVVLPLAYRLVGELAFRVSRLGIKVTERVTMAPNPEQEILRELSHGDYDLLVMGGVDRGADGRLYLGRTIQTVLTGTDIPAVLLVGHET